MLSMIFLCTKNQNTQIKLENNSNKKNSKKVRIKEEKKSRGVPGCCIQGNPTCMSDASALFCRFTSPHTQKTHVQCVCVRAPFIPSECAPRGRGCEGEAK